MSIERDIHLDLGSGDQPYEHTEGKTIQSDIYYDDVGGTSPDEPLMSIDAEHIPFRDESISRITSLAAMGIMTDLEESLAEAIRVLKSGGTLEIITYLFWEDAKSIRKFLLTQPIKNLYMRPLAQDFREEEFIDNVTPTWKVKFTKV